MTELESTLLQIPQAEQGAEVASKPEIELLLDSVKHDKTLKTITVSSRQYATFELYLGQYLANIDRPRFFGEEEKPKDYKALKGALNAIRDGKVLMGDEETGAPILEQMEFTGPQVAASWEIVHSGLFPFNPNKQVSMNQFVHGILNRYPSAPEVQTMDSLKGKVSKVTQFFKGQNTKQEKA